METVGNRALAETPAATRTSWWSEFGEYWARVPDKALFLALLAGWCVLFQFVGISSFNFGTSQPSLFEWLYNAWNMPAMDCEHGKLIPFVVAILLWIKRKELAATIQGVWWPALVIIGLALMIHVLGFLAQQPRISMVAFFLGMYGLVGLVWGLGTMWSSTFPLFLFGFCMPLGIYTDRITLPMRMISVTLTRGVCHGLLGIHVIQQGTELLDPNGVYQYDVVAACSGIRSFVALLAITSVFAILSMRSIWRRALMLASTVPVVIACNTLRLSVVVLVGKHYGQAKGEWVHDWFGYVSYLVALGLLMAVASALKEKPSQT
ncbi:MAG TPA: exosortase/archaeosortase family protein [Verrucomicrobiae bacterium]|jgi:exosortase